MKKYNELVEHYKREMDKCQRVCDEQHDVMAKAREEVKKAIQVATDEFTEGLEEKIKDWTSEDYDLFISMAEHDNRLDDTSILTISTAYARTHEDDKERVHNNVCERCLLETALESAGELLEAIGLR